jgi:hypothetical protein
MKLNKIANMKLVKFFLAILAGFGLIKIYQYVAEVELNEEEDYEIYEEEHDHPLFV